MLERTTAEEDHDRIIHNGWKITEGDMTTKKKKKKLKDNCSLLGDMWMNPVPWKYGTIKLRRDTHRNFSKYSDMEDNVQFKQLQK